MRSSSARPMPAAPDKRRWPSPTTSSTRSPTRHPPGPCPYGGGMKYVDVDGVGRVSRIGLGTWQFGSREWGYGDDYASAPARDIVQRARALGVTFFDTAEVYGLGKSEWILGEALRREGRGGAPA